MNTMESQGRMKGQMSFDLAFAMIFVLMLLTMVTNFTGNELASVEDGRSLAGMSMVGDDVAGKLTSFYDSLVLLENNASLNLELPAEFIYSDDSSKYALDYNLTFMDGRQGFTVVDSQDSQLKVLRSTPFSIRCSNYAPPSPPTGTYNKGDIIIFSNCTEDDANDELLCKSC